MKMSKRGNIDVLLGCITQGTRAEGKFALVRHKENIMGKGKRKTML